MSATASTGGSSSSVIVPVPASLSTTALTGLVSVMRKVSSASYRESSSNVTVTVFEISPEAKVSEPDAAR